MKKLLLGTTALVGASFAATAAMAAPEVRIGGYLDFQAGFVSQDTDGFGPAPGVPTVDSTRGFGFLTDTEILVRASDKLDNGLAWSVKIELEADADTVNPGTNDNADEVSIVFSGSWGQLTLGNEDGPVDAKNYIGDGQITGIGVSGARGYRRWTDTQSFSNGLEVAGVDPNNTSDATKIMYYTPTIAGFQFGVSYSADSTDNGAQRSNDGIAPVGASTNAAFENWFELGASYDVKVSDDFALGIAAAASIADAEYQTNVNDIKAWLISAKAEFAGFTASIGYSDSGDSGQAKGAGDVDVSNYAAALKYTTGPYQVGVSYAHAMAGGGTNSTAAGGLEFTADTFTLGAQYTLGAGLVVYADTWYYTNDSDGFAPASENSAIGLMLGTRATF